MQLAKTVEQYVTLLRSQTNHHVCEPLFFVLTIWVAVCDKYVALK